jgi:hypothetical protein
MASESPHRGDVLRLIGIGVESEILWDSPQEDLVL